MPKDAKLGLVVGVGLVIAVAVVFFRKDELTVQPEEEPAAATSVKPVPGVPKAVPRGQIRPTKAKPALHDEESGALEAVTSPPADQGNREGTHPVQDGATETIDR